MISQRDSALQGAELAHQLRVFMSLAVVGCQQVVDQALRGQDAFHCRFVALLFLLDRLSDLVELFRQALRLQVAFAVLVLISV